MKVHLVVILIVMLACCTGNGQKATVMAERNLPTKEEVVDG